MLAIKLQRIGKKHQPSFRLVVAEKRSKLPGPPIEDLGSFNPRSKNLQANKGRVNYWIGVGAQPTITVLNLLIKHRFIGLPKKAVKMRTMKKSTEAVVS